MTDWMISALADYGVILLFLTTFLSCLAMPVPASLLMLSGGAFVATGDLPMMSSVLSALCGAIAGDFAGYQLASRGRTQLENFMTQSPKRANVMARADSFLANWGGMGIFLSRWLFSPLGPYMNFASGVAAVPVWKFALFGILGECVWVSLYVGLGYVFADNLSMASDLAGDVLGLLAAICVMLGFGIWLVKHNRKRTIAPAN